jgi:hypothetical protein
LGKACGAVRKYQRPPLGGEDKQPDCTHDLANYQR